MPALHQIDQHAMGEQRHAVVFGFEPFDQQVSSFITYPFDAANSARYGSMRFITARRSKDGAYNRSVAVPQFSGRERNGSAPVFQTGGTGSSPVARAIITKFVERSGFSAKSSASALGSNDLHALTVHGDDTKCRSAITRILEQQTDEKLFGAMA